MKTALLMYVNISTNLFPDTRIKKQENYTRSVSNHLNIPWKIEEIQTKEQKAINKEYVIQSGDTFSAIAKRYGISLQFLMNQNSDINPNELQIRQKIRIPRDNNITSTSSEIHENIPQLSRELSEYVIHNYKKHRGGKNSCGMSVGNTLSNGINIKGLPSSGRHGYLWSDFLDERSDQFIKVAVSSPDEAKSGAILVYGKGGGGRRSQAAKIYGHVEIKGANNQYYSYYGSPNWGGSAGRSIEDSKFTGYAYYPISKTRSRNIASR